ncbi:TPA: YbaK/EbsC family protein [Listeria monocytogenes]|nr:YbaK/EbsC family protein [Listeria innocua]
MSHANVKKYFENIGLAERVVIRDSIGDTVEHASIAIGCKPAHIAKTMSFIQNENPLLIVTAGDAKIDNRKYKDFFKQRPKMVPADDLDTLIGHVAGAVTPFGINKNVKVYLDVSLKRFEIVHTSGGSINSTVTLSVDELEKHSQPISWIDVCKGWYINDTN